MRLVIDVGNTSIAYAYFKGERLLKRGHCLTRDYKKLRPSLSKVAKVIYASVVPGVDSCFAAYFKKVKFYNLTWPQIPFIKIKLANKAEIGIDRLVNAAGVAKLYGAPAIIIDLGTATTFCIVDKKNNYLGGLICPGINLTREVLHERTAKLPLVEINKEPDRLIGRNTREALQSGIFFGYCSLLEGLLIRLKKQCGKNYKVIATGGYAPQLARCLKQSVDIIDTELTLKSLNLIGESI